MGTLVATMTIEHSEVAHWYLVVQAQVLYALIRVLHALALSNVTHMARIEALDLELELSDPE